VRFWDSSAVVPLVVREPPTAAMKELLADDPEMLVWWGSDLQCAAAVAHREREGALESRQADEALQRVDLLKKEWHELQPLEPVRSLGRRLVRVHPLRAADALQLAAALVACEGDPSFLVVVTLDARLSERRARKGSLRSESDEQQTAGLL
jgi:predicted nucleic acid-binding protein